MKVVQKLQCPKCYSQLIMKKENWVETPYCVGCGTEWEIMINIDETEISITYTEKEKKKIFESKEPWWYDENDYWNEPQ